MMYARSIPTVEVVTQMVTVQVHTHACMDFVRGPQRHDRVPISLSSWGPGGPNPTGSPEFYDTGIDSDVSQ